MDERIKVSKLCLRCRKTFMTLHPKYNWLCEDCNKRNLNEHKSIIPLPNPKPPHPEI